MGIGPNRINRFTIKKATIGFGLYLLKQFDEALSRGVVIAHDNRHQSRDFNDAIAATFEAMGFKVFIFDELRPTPELSFAVRHLHAVGGIVVTASHNPKQYNGFKVYDENGCQLTPIKINPLIEIIAGLPEAIEVIVPPSEVTGQIITLGRDIDELYLKAIWGISLHPELPKQDFKVVFSPQHGAAYRLGVRVLEEMGYRVFPVVSQCYPDPNFTNTKSPNPELLEAYEEAIKLAKEVKADLIVITDPDADRVGVCYRDKGGKYVRLTGNQSGALLIDYVLQERAALGKLAHNGIVYDTIVTSPLGGKIARGYGCAVESFLTGFKFIGDRIDFYEKTGGPHFEFGYEESYGCLIAPFARDKDGLQALLMYTEMTLFHHLNGRNLGQQMNIIQKRHGFHADGQFSIDFKGVTGTANIAEMLTRLRRTPFKPIGSFKVVQFEDYLTQVRKTEHGQFAIALPSSDVIKFTLEEGSSITVRPSGTEPKCKFYYSAVGKSASELKNKVAALHQLLCTTYHINC
jgi:phosphoglucomutase